MPPDQLDIPDTALNDPKAFEVIRGWVASGGLHVNLQVGAWNDPGAWGIALADIVRHLANAYHETQGADRDQTAKRILALLDAELRKPTDKPRGWFGKQKDDDAG